MMRFIFTYSALIYVALATTRPREDWENWMQSALVLAILALAYRPEKK